jgi:cephalosporin hydroxylase
MSGAGWLLGGAVIAVVAFAAYRLRHRILEPLETPVLHLFHYFFYRDSRTTWSNMRWMGTRVLKCPFDLWVYQEILYETQPDVLVETGTNKGGSSLYFAHLFDLINKGRIISVDITHPKEGLPQHPRIEYLLGSSTAPEMLAAIRERIQPGEKVMVLLDSDHSEKHVSEELKLYSDLVTEGCYLVVEDTNLNGHPVSRGHGPGPMEAVKGFLATRSDFVPDKSREKFKLTFYPDGWLKRLPART